MSSADDVIPPLCVTGHDQPRRPWCPSFSEDASGPASRARPSGTSRRCSATWAAARRSPRASLQAALDGRPNPGGEFNQSVWDRWNAMTRRQRADGFRAGERGGRPRLYESLDASTRGGAAGRPGIPAGAGGRGRPRRGLRLSELALHSWDVRVASDEHATLAPRRRRTALTSLALRHRLGQQAGTARRPALGHPGHHARPESVFALRLHDRVTVDFDVPEQPDGTLTLPAEAWLRPGRRPARALVHPKRRRHHGATDLDLLRRVFPGYQPR